MHYFKVPNNTHCLTLVLLCSTLCYIEQDVLALNTFSGSRILRLRMIDADELTHSRSQDSDYRDLNEENKANLDGQHLYFLKNAKIYKS